MTALDDEITGLKTTMDGIAADLPPLQAGITTIQANVTTLQNELASAGVPLSPTAQAALDSAVSESAAAKTTLDGMVTSLTPAAAAKPAGG